MTSAPVPVGFLTPEWAEAYKDAINADGSGYGTVARTWTHGAVAIVVEPDPEAGFDRTVAVVLDLHEGRCRAARVTDQATAATAPFVISGTYSRWKAVTTGRLDPIKGIVHGRLRLKGRLPTLVRYVRASQALIAVAAHLDVVYPDEPPPATAEPTA